MTLTKTLIPGGTQSFRDAVDSITHWLQTAKNTKDMIISFRKEEDILDPPIPEVSGQYIAWIRTFQLQGIHFSSDLYWNKNAEETTS